MQAQPCDSHAGTHVVCPASFEGKELPDPAGGSNKFFQLLWLNTSKFQGPHSVSVCSPSALMWMEIDVKTTAP